jgi:hypothetical protein
VQPLRVQAVFAPPVVRACGATIGQAARQRGAVEVAVEEAGPLRSAGSGTRVTPLDVEIVYERRGRSQVRQARVSCHVDRSGRVVALR